jgi:hypothetical protein
MSQHSPPMISMASTKLMSRLPPGRDSNIMAPMTPMTNKASDINIRRLICDDVGGAVFAGAGTRSMLEESLSGAPQPMQAAALLLTARPHSLQVIIAMTFSGLWSTRRALKHARHDFDTVSANAYSLDASRPFASAG